jgi:hypothetical protein
MAQKVNINIDQGATFNVSYDVNDSFGEALDFSGYTVESEIRKTYSSLSSVAFDASIYSNGFISLYMSSNITEDLSSGRYVYDVKVTDPYGIKTRVVEGIVTVSPAVTK